MYLVSVHLLGREPQFMVISLHSCGNLTHHGLRSLVANLSVKAVAVVGCCYNLVTERLGPPTFKLHSMCPPNQSHVEASSLCDPCGFPMSAQFASYRHREGCGIRLNISARMMAVQAPQNWTETECESFFTRHFYRALLQRILVDQGFIERTVNHCEPLTMNRPIVIGSLRKACYRSFPAYVRGAVAKLKQDDGQNVALANAVGSMSDEELWNYEGKYKLKRHQLSVLWSLMAFSAGVVESAIVADRWQYLKEQEEVKHCWVQTVFDYAQSPRNLAVVGVKG